VAHIVALAYVAASLIAHDARWLTRPWAWWVVICGRHSLHVFCFGIVLSMVGFVIMAEAGAGLGTQIIVNAVGLALLGSAAWKLAQLKRAKARAGSMPGVAARP
jgi:hypothetical protein